MRICKFSAGRGAGWRPTRPPAECAQAEGEKKAAPRATPQRSAPRRRGEKKAAPKGEPRSRAECRGARGADIRTGRTAGDMTRTPAGCPVRRLGARAGFPRRRAAGRTAGDTAGYTRPARLRPPCARSASGCALGGCFPPSAEKGALRRGVALGAAFPPPPKRALSAGGRGGRHPAPRTAENTKTPTKASSRRCLCNIPLSAGWERIRDWQHPSSFSCTP